MTHSTLQARAWLPGAGVVTLVHAALVASAIWMGMGERIMPRVEPVVLIDLPPLEATATPTPIPVQPSVEQAIAEPVMANQITAPTVAAPLPRHVVALPPPVAGPVVPAVRPAAQSAAPTQTPVPTQSAPAASGSSQSTGDNPRAKLQEADYFSQLSAHLNKRKRYPSEAKKARQQGVVTVRFTVRSDGSVFGSSIRKSSGHDLLDAATLDLLQRVSPLPRFPKSMTKESVTLSLPIDYSLQTT